MEIPLAVHKKTYSPLCEGLDEVPSELSLLRKTRRLLATVAYPVEPWHTMCMDLITSLPESQGYDAILLMVERFAKLAHMVPIVGTATALETTWPFLKGWLRHHGLPRVIVSDQDPKFTSAFSMHFSKEVGRKLWFSTALHSQMDGKTQRVNGVLKQYLRNLVGADQGDWADYVGRASLVVM